MPTDGSQQSPMQPSFVAASTGEETDQLQLLLAAQQLQGGVSSSTISPSLTAILLQQHLHNQRLSPQVLALLDQRRRQEQLLAQELGRLQQQQQQQQQHQQRTSHLDGFSSDNAGTSLDLLLARQQLLQRLDDTSLLRASLLFRSNAESSTPLSTTTPVTADPQRDKLKTDCFLALKDASSDDRKVVPEDATTSEEFNDQSKDGIDDDSHDTFPFKLYRMLSDASKDGQESIVSFNDTGKSFAIHKPQLFVSKIMPKYFTTSRMSSFQRQLNLYGFRRVAEGPQKGSYWHESFVRGNKAQCKYIRRKKPSVKLPPSAFSYLLGYPSGGEPATSSQNLSVRQLIAEGQLTAEQRMLTANQHTNQALAAAVLLERERLQQNQNELLSRLILQQQQGREREWRLIGQQGEDNVPKHSE